MFEQIRRMPGTPTPGPDAARSADFLHDEHGCPLLFVGNDVSRTDLRPVL